MTWVVYQGGERYQSQYGPPLLDGRGCHPGGDHRRGSADDFRAMAIATKLSRRWAS